jgi:hypothetical protein
MSHILLTHFGMAGDTMRGRERAVRFDDLVRGNAGDSFERVDFFSVGAIIAK